MDDRLPRKLAAILYADVAGYSRLTGNDEDATHRKLSEYLDLIAKTVVSSRGRVMHYAGDAVLAMFDAVVDAVSSATDIQKQLGIRNSDLPDQRKVQFRIGVNLGDVIEDRGDIYGDGVNIAARLESLAEPGGICISESVRTALGSKLNLGYEALGEQKVKNIAEPVRAYRIGGFNGEAGVASKSAQPAAVTEKPSIVVLPFQNMSKEADNDFFVDGITEEIRNALCRFREIVVAAQLASIQVNEQNLDVAESASKIGVKYALSGSVRRAGDRVRITASLVEGETGHQIWSEQYDHVLDDIFQVQDDVAQRIVTMLVGKIERSDRERSLRKETDNLSAYECVLNGRYHFNEWHGTRDSVMQARELFEKAIELDPRYAAAWSGLAATYHDEAKHGWTSDFEITADKSIELAKKAIELDEHDSFAHLVLSSAYWRFKANFELAKSQIDAAIEQNPNYYWNYCYGSWFSICNGDLENSVYCSREALRRNPILPDSCLYSLGFTEYLLGDYEKAISTICQITNLEPDNYACLAASYAQLGRIDEARKVVTECIEYEGNCGKSAIEWREYWHSELNFKEEAPINHLIEGLDKAGLVSH
jgi:adenylate cyclase